jgi:putative SOS response-associated peptidase YedK
MSTQYECLKSADLYAEAFGVAPPENLLGKEVWPRQQGLFIRKAVLGAEQAPESHSEPTSESSAEPSAEPPAEPTSELGSEAEAATAPVQAAAIPLVMELAQGQFGLVPTWVKSASDAKLRSTKLAVTRYETMSTSTNSRDAWLKGQRCIIPMQAFIEEDWRSGKAVPTRIARVDGKPMGVAGLWEHWTKDGEEITSFTLLTVNANSHALMNRYGQNGNEKRMPAILNEGAWSAWLTAPLDKAREFMRAYPTHLLLANPVQKK